MTTEPSPALRNISDTAVWVAMYRAQESERRDALFHDPYARRLVGERGEQILSSLASGRRMSWPMVVRTVVFDEVVMRLVRDEGADTVLNLAAGLDARPWRLPLPESLRWIDVDLPDMLDYKRRQLEHDVPKCRHEARAVDLRDVEARRRLLAEVGGSSRRTLVITEGLLIYLPPESVAELGRDLAAQPSFRWWLIDLVSPLLLQRLRKTWGRALDRANAPFLFGPEAGTRFFEPQGWREREFHSVWEDAKRIKRRMPGAWVYDMMFAFMPAEKRRKFSRFAGNVLLESSRT